MGELLMLGATERKMVVEIYGQELKLIVREPTRKELVVIPMKLQKLSARKGIEETCKLGLHHLIKIEGLGVQDEKGKPIPLITDPDQKGFRKDWRSVLAKDSVGIKVGGLVASKLYNLGTDNNQAEEDEDLEDFDLGDFGSEEEASGEAEAAPEAESGGKKK